ncbi:tyrosine-type recombinase/integrase [Burkholderia gladioli]|uniref:tyrosine-type recombinase/integrase n=1 Tax=Burkholderia gladioli TaxID=28095 RepID=UPI0016413B42|nr:integrase family protein [Burkholderia gladioli]
MRFDARAAKQMQPGTHITIDGCPGLRLEATATRRSWTYRYKSPVDDRMRQTKIGEWPALSLAAAAGEWEKLRSAREAGSDPALAKRLQANPALGVMVTQDGPLTVRQVCRAYLVGHVERNRKSKGAAEAKRMFDTMLGEFGDRIAEQVTRGQAFALLESYAHIPVQARRLRQELGAAWDYALDASTLAETTPNWWRQIMRGRLRSTGKRISGESTGTKKRVLANAETGRLINWLPNFSRTVHDALILYLWTGTRGGEIGAMTGKEISEEADGLWWTIPKAKTKNARHPNATDLRVPLVGRAEEVVRRRWARYGDGYLIPSTRGAQTEQKVFQSTVWMHQPYATTRPEMERPRLTVTHWAPHDLRRTARTMLAALGCPFEVGEAIIGHMLPGVGGVYNLHKYDEQRRHWLTLLNDKLEELAIEDRRSGAGQSRN